jgi:hypothetical protein
MVDDERQPEAPDGSFGGFLFLLIIVLTVMIGVAQLIIAKQYAILGFATTIIAGLCTAFLVRASRSPRAGENTEDKK